MSDCQSKFYRENFEKESALKVAKGNSTKIPLKHRLRISTFQLSPGNRLYRIEQGGVASSTKELHSLKQREVVKQKESANNGKQEPMDHHQIQSELTCSICNRQFKAKHDLNSH